MYSQFMMHGQKNIKKRNVSVVRLIVATRSSGPPASQPLSCLTRLIIGKIFKEMPVSVGSGTPYIIICVLSGSTMFLHII